MKPRWIRTRLALLCAALLLCAACARGGEERPLPAEEPPAATLPLLPEEEWAVPELSALALPPESDGRESIPQTGEPVFPQPGDTTDTWDPAREGDFPPDARCSPRELLDKWMAVEGLTLADLEARDCRQLVLAVCGASAAVLQNPPQPVGQPNAKAANDLPPHQMVRTTQYRLCVAGVALAAPPMLLFSPEILTIAADRGLPEQWAPLCVAVGSAASAAGRLLCPAASDHWGRKPVLYGVYAALAAGSIGFAFAQGWWVLAAYCVLTCFYSGGAAVQPALNTDLFGLAHAGVNYGLIALGMSAGSLLSYAGSQLLDLPARHMLAVASAVAGGICFLFVKPVATVEKQQGNG